MSLIDLMRARFEASADIPAPLSGDMIPLEDKATVPAAVLVAITDRPEPGLILTRRNEALRKHPGQIAFAGGRADPGDLHPIDTALREAHEEIGMPRDRVTVIGCDAPYRTVTHYSIIPVIGIVPPDLALMPREFEVADIFEVPLAHVLDPANQLRREGEFRGERRGYYEILWQDRRIWGATAAMIVNLSRRFAA
ncbi:CoA pyrophosphatase [Sphingomonas abietis]|uniref:CoA pyrophosphatase n=1 Tax=Sphingomonas abietis TaxID=3012344 RepID=A0ABY7NLU4_9SPHN|nr:CoA pyrophosphatase [Sphingomonas abietis]WBO22202.1 CoA pyrophosphatase [Sphingomonas abietis]